jgi:predicted nucleotidyltransferase
MDFQRPVEAVIPGAAGRLLAALARVDTELPISTLATVAAVGRTRASGLIAQLHELGVVDRREIGRTTMVSLARENAAGQLLDQLGHLRTTVLARLRDLAGEIEPHPLTVTLFGSFARGEATASSDIDILAIRAPGAGPETWASALGSFTTRARRLTGNPVQVLDYDLEELRRRASSRAKAGRNFWNALRLDGIVLAGSSVDILLENDHVPSR